MRTFKVGLGAAAERSAGLGVFCKFLARLFCWLIFAMTMSAVPASAASPLCSSSGDDQSYEWVSRLQVDTNNVVVPKTGYYDASGSSIASLVADQSASLEVDVETDGETYAEYVKVWLDLNQDGIVEATDELVSSIGPINVTTFHTFASTITVPSDAYNGTMYGRVIMQFNASPALCGTYTYGTTVDFQVTVTGATDNPDAPQPPQNISAVPGDGQATISFDAPESGPEPVGYVVTSNPGDIVFEGTESPITVSGLSNGTEYTFTVVSKVDDTTFSEASASSNAVTPQVTLSSNADLAGLVPSQGSLSPAFTAGTLDYAVSVPNSVTSLTLTPTVADNSASVTVEGSAVSSGMASGAIALAVGDNTIEVVVTAEDATTKIYEIVVTRAASANADLSGLVPSAGSLSPAFSAGTLEYAISVANSVTVLTLTPTTADATASITVEGTAVTSGTASGPVALPVGDTAVEVVVTAEDGTTTNTYEVVVTRAPSTNAELAGLVSSQGSLAPAFTPGTHDYTISVSNDVTSLSLTPVAADSTASITVGGTAVASGSASGAIALAVGENTIEVVVTAQDGSTQTYSIVVTRARSDDASLSNLVPSQGSLSPSFATGTLEYTIPVGNDVTSLTLTPTVTDSSASIRVAGAVVASGSASGAITLAVGDTAINVVVTAGDGLTTNTYEIVVTRAASENADLAALVPSQGSLSPTFAAGTLDYTISVGNSVSSLALTPTTADTMSSVTVNGANVTSGTASGALALAVGENTIDVVVRAEDGTTTQTYTVVVTRFQEMVFEPSGGNLPEAMAGEDYSAKPSVSGGTGALVFTHVGGDLPTWLVLNRSTGELTARSVDADAEGEYTFTIEVTDSIGNSETVSYTLVVGERKVTAKDKEITLGPGEKPKNVDLTAGATGGPFIDAAIVEVSPANAGTAEIVNGQYAQAGGGGAVEFFLKFTPDPGFSGEATVRFRLVSPLGTSNTAIVVYNLNVDTVAVARDVDTSVRRFVQSRLNMLATGVDLPGLLDRRRLQAAGAPVSGGLRPQAGGVELEASTSLAQIRSAESRGDLALLPYNAWIDGTLRAYNRTDNGLLWGTFGLVSGGIDYLVDDKTLVGFSAHLDYMRDPTSSEETLSGMGWLVGPYGSFELGEGVFLDTSLLYGGSHNTVDTTFFDGSFETTRWIWDATISGAWEFDEFTTFTPSLQVRYLNETVEDYTVSSDFGDTIGLSGFTQEQFRLGVGGELTKVIPLENGLTLMPTVGVRGGISGLDGSGAYGLLSAGFTLTSDQMWTFSADSHLTLDGSNQRAVGVSLGLSGRF